jgi:hypothetical protein
LVSCVEKPVSLFFGARSAKIVSDGKLRNDKKKQNR